MTHDELLGKIDETSEWINSTPLSSEFQTRLLNQNKALRAVVELHYPDIPSYCYEDTGCCGDECVVCGESYPCPTIQAIEKELS